MAQGQQASSPYLTPYAASLSCTERLPGRPFGPCRTPASIRVKFAAAASARASRALRHRSCVSWSWSPFWSRSSTTPRSLHRRFRGAAGTAGLEADTGLGRGIVVVPAPVSTRAQTPSRACRGAGLAARSIERRRMTFLESRLLPPRSPTARRARRPTCQRLVSGRFGRRLPWPLLSTRRPRRPTPLARRRSARLGPRTVPPRGPSRPPRGAHSLRQPTGQAGLLRRA